MTKTWVLGDETKVARDPIELCFCIDLDKKAFDGLCVVPTAWDNIILIRKGNQYDTIYAHNDGHPLNGCLYLGHWNSGRV